MTAQTDRTLGERLEQIERRLLAIESRLSIAPPTEPATEPISRQAPVTSPHGAEQPRARQPAQDALPRGRPKPASRPAKPKREPISIETLVGGKVFAVVGALVIVTGLALFLKLAYDLGWLALISPAGKCLAGAGFGAALLAAGEFALRKWSAAASAALSATGVGALYASAYAAYTFYQLVPAPGAFALLAGVSAIGLIVALRARLASVAVLSILSAYLTPILMSDSDAPAFVLPSYLLAIVGVGLTLSVIHERFRVLRSLVWWGTALLGTLWVLSEARHAPVVAVAFLTLSWLAFHAELWLSARRGGMGSGVRLVDASRPLLVSLGSTSWAVLLTALTLATQNSPELWLAPGGAMVFTSILSLITAGHLRVLTDTPRTDEERLGACLMAQSGALFIAAIAMGVTTDWLQISAWLAFGVASVFAGRWVRSRALDVYGVVVLSIGLARLVLLDSWLGTMHTGGVETLGLVLTEWTLMMAIAGAAWIGAGVLLLGETAPDRPRVFPILAALIGSISLLASLMHPDAEYASLTLAWGAAAAVAIGVHPLQRRLALDAAGVFALALSYVAWTLAYLHEGWTITASDRPIHPGLFSALALVGITLVASRWLRARETAPGFGRAMAGAGVLLLLVSTSFEIARHVVRLTDDAATQAGAVSIWWGLFATALLLWGFLAKRPPVRWAGLALLGVATGKAVILDLAGVDPAWRVASFLGLGLLMIGVGTWYLRAVAKAGAERARSDEGRAGASHADSPRARA